ncbi:SOS response-associated peptidase [Pseudomonas sp. HR96]|uniref:SOS response-associated peptidase n=1 Tax=Pseudomonas sp. HR96 TaxID=1027966 RepID=UPI002A74F217|nr:SOS response-associated peptidase [Pseudomonas sp. HR96]WPO98087.1 SOS response-associated peptidase [Pseudomonas sp. HR96]
MCGRYSMYQPMEVYLRELAPQQLVISYVEPEPASRYNIAPSTRVPVIVGESAGLRLEQVRWGWEPFWAKGKRPPSINARSETVATSRFFKQLWPQGRVLVPANGWYEWVKDAQDPKKKQPYYIRLKDRAPMFFAGLAQVTPGLAPGEGDGVVIITDASDAGMVDIHDRRPVVLGPEAARQWLEYGLEAAQADELMRGAGRAVADFEWYRVGPAVGNVRNQGGELIDEVVVPPLPETGDLFD